MSLAIILAETDHRTRSVAAARIPNPEARLPELSGGPGERTAREQVQVDVEDRLTGGTVGVEHGPIAFIGVSVLFRDGCGHTLHRAHQRIVVRTQIVQRGDMTARNDQDVQGRLRVDIPDRNDLVILMDEASRDLSCDDLAEEAIVHDR